MVKRVSHHPNLISYKFETRSLYLLFTDLKEQTLVWGSSCSCWPAVRHWGHFCTPSTYSNVMLKVHLQISSLTLTLLIISSSNQVVILRFQGRSQSQEKDPFPLLFAAASELKEFPWENYKTFAYLLWACHEKTRASSQSGWSAAYFFIAYFPRATFSTWGFFRWHFLPHWQNTLFSPHLISCTMNRQTFTKWA